MPDGTTVVVVQGSLDRLDDKMQLMQLPWPATENM
jgi:hypothetical protein